MSKSSVTAAASLRGRPAAQGLARGRLSSRVESRPSRARSSGHRPAREAWLSSAGIPGANPAANDQASCRAPRSAVDGPRSGSGEHRKGTGRLRWQRRWPSVGPPGNSPGAGHRIGTAHGKFVERRRRQRQGMGAVDFGRKTGRFRPEPL